MGGQAIARHGQAITVDPGFVSVDTGADTCNVQAGTRWRQVMGALDPMALSPKVMQTNIDFCVAATLSVNAHGWATVHGPMGATVRSVQLMLADGGLITASRTGKRRSFRHCNGGYGLIGMITELEVEHAPNQLLESTFQILPAADIAAAFAAVVGEVPMAYGRLNVDRDGFFEDAMMISYRPVASDLPPTSGSGFLSKLSRPIFRAQVGNDWVKRRRWGIETGLYAMMTGLATRNSLFNEPVIILDDRDPHRHSARIFRGLRPVQ